VHTRKRLPALSLTALASIAALATAADRSAPAVVEGTPAAWLSAAEKSEEWKPYPGAVMEHCGLPADVER
jgi:hypothetical protein